MSMILQVEPVHHWTKLLPLKVADAIIACRKAGAVFKASQTGGDSLICWYFRKARPDNCLTAMTMKLPWIEAGKPHQKKKSKIEVLLSEVRFFFSFIFYIYY